MTENQFLEDISFYQRRFERLHRAIIKDMKQYMNKNPVYDSTFYKTVEGFSANITITGDWVNLLRGLNSNKYTNMLRFPNEFNNYNGAPDKVRPSVDGRMPIKIRKATVKLMTQYTNDPRMIKAKFTSCCSKCRAKLTKGVNIYYWPSSREVFCMTCGGSLPAIPFFSRR